MKSTSMSRAHLRLCSSIVRKQRLEFPEVVNGEAGFRARKQRAQISHDYKTSHTSLAASSPLNAICKPGSRGLLAKYRLSHFLNLWEQRLRLDLPRSDRGALKCEQDR